MDQNIDPVTGETVETPSASPAETITPEPTGDVNQSGASNATTEEVAWSGLKGGTQDRIKQILKERDMWKYEAERRAAYQAPQYPTPTEPANSAVQNAVAQLSNVGIATDEKVDQKINQRIGNLIYNFELEKLSDKYDGSNGLPKFDRAEYEDYINRYPQYQSYDPKDVYEKMYAEEILDAKIKERESTSSKPSTSVRPTRTAVREEQWSPEWIEQRMQQPDGLNWYANNKEKVNSFLASLTKE